MVSAVVVWRTPPVAVHDAPPRTHARRASRIKSARLPTPNETCHLPSTFPTIVSRPSSRSITHPAVSTLRPLTSERQRQRPKGRLSAQKGVAILRPSNTVGKKNTFAVNQREALRSHLRGAQPFAPLENPVSGVRDCEVFTPPLILTCRSQPWTLLVSNRILLQSVAARHLAEACNTASCGNRNRDPLG